MKFLDILKLSISNLMQRGLRSWLTVLGIIIGVAAVVAIVSVGEGMKATVSVQLQRFGVDTVTITPGYSRAMGAGAFGMGGQGLLSGNLTQNDEKIIQTIPNVAYVNGIVSGRTDVSYLDEKANINVEGINTVVWRYIVSADISAGRYLTQGDAYVAVIGSNIANSLFKQQILLNRQMFINGQAFIVVGILQPSTVVREDSTIYIPRDVAWSIIPNVNKNQFTSIVVRASPNSNLTALSGDIETVLLTSHRISKDKKDFSITTTQAMQERMSQVTQTMTVFLSAIAVVSLIVGGIGIANTMFMSVMERTRQIGILKALGTTNWEVMKLFLVESGLLGLVGGAFGVLFGVIVSDMITKAGIRLIGIPGGGRATTTLVTPELILFALAFSIIIGIISGVFPAKRAAELQPVEALRYE